MSLQYKEQFIEGFKKFGNYLQHSDEKLENAKYSACASNSWFTKEEVDKAIRSLANMFNNNDLEKWFEQINITSTPRKVGLILAGNIPMVGFHDVICVLATGNIAQIKMSSSDNKLLPFVLQQLCEYLPLFKERIIFTDKLQDFDAVIATGSNNSSRYFEYYFGKVPHIIRKNRNSVAILTGDETHEEIINLGNDIFDYFGMGCRNVSKIYLPKNYDVKNLFEPLEKFKSIIDHHKYHNNYDYNKSIYLVNQAAHYDNGFILLKEDESLNSPLAVLHFEYYDDLGSLNQELNAKIAQIQCLVGNVELSNLQVFPFGESQNPRLWDYADNVNAVEFLNNLTK